MNISLWKRLRAGAFPSATPAYFGPKSQETEARFFSKSILRTTLTTTSLGVGSKTGLGFVTQLAVTAMSGQRISQTGSKGLAPPCKRSRKDCAAAAG
jgi:hypothetical protein